MEQTESDGPDGSSLRPVSSLLARFENFNKGPDGAPLPSKPPSRPISPAPKPEKLKELKIPQDQSFTAPIPPSTPKVPPKPADKPKTANSSFPRQQEVDTAAHPPPPPLATKPILAAKPLTPKPPPPAVTVQPPLSPPKGRVSSIVAEDQPAFLNPESVASPVTTLGGSPKPFKTPTRPTTPTPAVPPPRSPRGSRPPSPPPPRRSGEYKREPPPPPAPRRERVLTPEPPATQADIRNASKQVDLKTETSPFNSPPGSPEPEEEIPPQLPTRPRPQNAPEPVAHSASVTGGFAPPPVHHSVATRRRGAASEVNGSGTSDHTSHHENGDIRPGSLPRQSTLAMRTRPISVHHGSETLPRPPRPNVAIPPQHLGHTDPISAPIPSSKRVNSNPTTQKLPIPPTRGHNRAVTVDRTDRTTAEPWASQTQVVSAPQAPPISQVPATKAEGPKILTAFPDCSSTNRRPPFMKKGIDEISAKNDVRIFDVCGAYVCTSGQYTRIYSTQDGDMLTSFAHTEGIKATAVSFKPAASPDDEGRVVWIGTSSGELMEVDVEQQSITPSKGSVHQRREVIRIFRHFNELWTMDELGTLLVWGPDETGVPNITGSPHQSYKMPREHSFSIVVGDELWHATGKEIRVFAPTLDGRVQFQVLIRPLTAEGAGDVTCGTLVKTQPGKVYFGHADGKVSVFSTKDYTCLAVLSISTWKINCMAGVGHRMWIGYNTGKICVCDMSDAPWSVLKEWQAHPHQTPVLKLKSDPASSYQLDRIQVASLGADSKVKLWDGLLEDDWVEDEMKSKDTEYCDFDELKAMVFTWNAGASTPHSLRYSGTDANFFPELLQNSGSPDILVFGFQELVDLEDKAATAKRFLKAKKKEGTDQQSMAHQYRDWKNFLMKTLDDYMPADDLYHLLHTAPLVGLFTCVFVKASLRDRIRGLSGAEVKRGMGGLHGNKGAVVVRFKIDDTSLCFVNCHLAAGQSQAQARHNDIAEILEASLFTAERDPAFRLDSFSGGGDGTLVVDHELCVVNGDLNYRIDTMSRDTVVTAVKQNNLTKLLERDQLLVARRRNPAFKLRAFEEMPITFAPTYKYDVGTDRYDTSEKRRSPAWCDRLLYRGRGRVQQHDYQRHEVYVSDHRPVTGNFSFWVKKIRPKERTVAWMESQQSFEAVRVRETANAKLHYLTAVCGYDETTSKQLIKDKGNRRLHRSPSRGREPQ